MLLRQKINIILLFCFMSFTGMTQIGLDNSIRFTSDTSGNRQVENLAFPNTFDDAVGSEYFMNGSLNYYEMDTLWNDTLYLKNVFGNSQLTEGMKINFLFPSTTNDKLFLSINQSAPVPLVSNYFDTLMLGSFETGTILSAIFEGNSFQLITPAKRICPDGFIDVNTQYCIQSSEAPTAYDFYGALNYCHSNGNRICSWAEWYYACQKTGLGLSNMTNNYEWVNENCNTAGSALVIGSGTCRASTPIAATGNLRRFRCCYSK